MPICRCFALLMLCLVVTAVGAAAADLNAFSAGQPRIILDVPPQFVSENQLGRALADFERCFREMTGVPLPNTAARAAQFDPATPVGLRLETTVLAMEDKSSQGNENGMVSLVLTPAPVLEGNVLGGPGERVVWSCSWHRAKSRLAFSLIVSNQGYHGPGYGPFTFVTLEAPLPKWTAGETVQLALELRRGGGQDVRGGYRVGGGEWVHTDWFDPTRAGTDTREPGVSDKLGPQGWTADWPATWAGKTAAYVAGYAAKGRDSRMRVDDFRLTSGEQVLFSDGFTAADGTAGHNLPNWRQGPRQGQAIVEGNAMSFIPDPAAWNTVGLAAAVASERPAGAVPLRLVREAVPEGASKLDSAVWQGWRRQATPEGITLYAYTPLGLQNALYALLDHWGCRWVMAGELGECIPRVQRLSVPAGTVRFAPRSNFAVAPCGANNAYAEFFQRNQGGFHNWLSAQHYWFHAISPEKHFKDHPEWYSLIAGQRQPRQLCTSNPEVIAEMIRVAKQYLAGGAERVAFPMDPQDNADFCECEQCRALDPPGRVRGGNPVVTDRVLHFVNAVANAIREDFPDRYVGFYAYWSHDEVPVREKPAPNVVVGITRMNYCLLHLNPTRQCATSDFHSFVRGWQKLTPNVFAYEYDPISWTGGLPCPIYLEMGRSLRTMLGEMKVMGSYSDMGVLPAAHAATYLNRYIPLRMKVNPDQRPEDVLADMCQAFFGPAAAPLEQHYLEMAKSAERPHPGLQAIGVGTTYYHRLFDRAQIQRARAALDRGLALTRGKAPYDQRVAMVDLAQQYLEAYLGGVWAAQDKQYEKSVAEFDRMDHAITALGEKGWLDAKDASVRARAMRGKTLAEHFPEKLGYVSRWKLLGPFDNTANDADKRRETFEPLGSTDPVQTADGRTVAWWDVQSPGGFLNLEQTLAPKKPARDPWTLSYAFAATSYEAARPMSAQIRCDSFYPFRVFLNGEEVFYKSGLNADYPDRQRIDVRLRQGANLIILKLCQTGLATDSFPWGIYLRVVPDEAQEVLPLPERWSFQTDPEDRGVSAKWFDPACDVSNWKPIRIAQTWESQIGPYDGVAWYRTEVDLPATLPLGKLALQFTGVDEEAWVYVNGQLVGERTVQSTGRTAGEIWEEAFAVTLPAGVLRAGQRNVLVVRVRDSSYAGGLYRAVKLVAMP